MDYQIFNNNCAMYSFESLKKIFNFGKVCVLPPHHNPRFKQYAECLIHSCLNDNQVIQLVYKVGEELGLSGLPTDLDFTYNPNLPPEVLNVLDTLRGEVPCFQGFQSDKEAFDMIRSRYDQFGGELDDYVHHLVDVINGDSPLDGSSETSKSD